MQRILPDLEIDRIEYPQLQKEVKPDADAKSIQLDVYVKDDKNTVYMMQGRRKNQQILVQSEGRAVDDGSVLCVS